MLKDADEFITAMRSYDLLVKNVENYRKREFCRQFRQGMRAMYTLEKTSSEDEHGAEEHHDNDEQREE